MIITPSCEFASFFQREISANEVENPLGTNGTMSNASIVDALFGRGIEFTGSNNSYAEFGVLNLGLTDLVVNVVFKADAGLTGSASGGARIIHDRHGGAFGSQKGFQICCYQSGGNVWLTNTQISSGSGPSGAVGLEQDFNRLNTGVGVNEWCNLVMVWDRSTRWKFFANGVNIFDEPVSKSVGDISSGRTLLFGSNKSNQPFSGIVNRGIIWKKLFPDTDVRRISYGLHPLNG